MTNWTPVLENHTGPRYRALAAAIEHDICAGSLEPGERLPTHRSLAERLGVTVGTVTRGYAEAERRGLVEARVGSGTYVRRRGNRSAGFSIAETARREDVLDLGLAFTVPAARERMLGTALRQIADDAATLADVLGYQPENGLLRHREAFARWLRDWGYDFDPGEILVTLGGLHAVHLALQSAARPGETICSAGLTYPGLIATARQLGLRHVGLPLDDHGIVPEAFENACQQHAPRALYCVPNQNNPTTAAMPLQRRQSIVEIAQRHGVVLIEDDVNLIDPSERPPALVELAPDRVVHVSSCSKTLAEGLRVGIVRPPASLREAMGNALRSQCWMAPPLMAEVACRWIHSGVAAELARTQREEIGARQALVDRVFAGRSYSSQPYGFNVWLRLPEPWRASAFVDRCRERGVVIKTGEPFAVGSYPVPQAVRICVSAAPSREALRVGLESIRAVLEEVPSVSLSVL